MALLGGAMGEAAFQLGAAAMSFRLLETIGLRVLFDNFFGRFGGYPLTIFGSPLQMTLTFIIPVAFVAYLPVTVLLDRTDEIRINPLLAYASPLIGILLLAAAYLLWHRELHNYQSAGH